MNIRALFSAVAFLLLSSSFASNSRIVFVDINGTDDSRDNAASHAPARTIRRALEIADSLEPSIELPVLIQLGVGEFNCPAAVVNLKKQQVIGQAQFNRATNTITLRDGAWRDFEPVAHSPEDTLLILIQGE